MLYTYKSNKSQDSTQMPKLQLFLIKKYKELELLKELSVN